VQKFYVVKLAFTTSPFVMKREMLVLGILSSFLEAFVQNKGVVVA